LTALRELDLSDNENISDAGLAHLARLTQLHDLDVEDTKVTAAGLAHFKRAQQGGAGADPKPTPAAAKVRLPKYFDQLDLTEEQKDKISRTAQRYDDKIAELRQKLDAARRVRVGTTGLIISLTNAIKKLTNERQQALEDLLTGEQRDKLRQLQAGK
jgi:Spy/CpxP family protein refolding chaperone